MYNRFKKYIIFWLSQSISQLGSAMTGFALILWAYAKSNSALTVSLMSFCNYVPYIIVSLFAGSFVDSHDKKKIMLAADTAAAVCSAGVFMLYLGNRLQVWHIYLVNGIIGFMNAFQSPASAVAIGRIVPKEKLANISGMNSFSGNLISVLTPVLAAFLFALKGLRLILMIDLCSFVMAFLVLLLVISVPETDNGKTKRKSIFAGCRDSFSFLRRNRGIFVVILTMALLNFFSRLTYENILSPMILSRSGNNSTVLGAVNAVMGIGQSPLVWAAAGLAASLPVPFINARQNVILYQKVPDEMQGRVFAVRNAIQYSTIPVGILLGGFLADYVFEPYMMTDSKAASFLHMLVGEGAGSGMAVMFLCTGICGSLFSFLSYRRKEIQALR